jgi:hypothetical protein
MQLHALLVRSYDFQVGLAERVLQFSLPDVALVLEVFFRVCLGRLPVELALDVLVLQTAAVLKLVEPLSGCVVTLRLDNRSLTRSDVNYFGAGPR